MKSVVSTVILRIDSARETASLACATARSSAASTSASCAAVSTSIGRRPCVASQPGSISASSVTSAPMKGRWSPTTTTWLTSGCARSRSSSTAGATFLPPAVTMISFLRPVMRR
ncbi:Uncharacterised protein [Mycobacteroides abscessus]|nr:Uncharacterised protein [Mycobacteroides abscessus]